MFAAIPLLILPVAAYNLIVLTLDGGFHAQGASMRMAEPLMRFRMASGSEFSLGVGDLLLSAALLVLFIELLRSTSSRSAAIVNHGLSMLLFVGALIEFLLMPAFATATFFLLTLMVLLDVLAGFIVTVVAARRDMDFTR